MPLTSRTFGQASNPDGAGSSLGRTDRQRSIEILTSVDLDHIVDLVCWRDGDWLHAAAYSGEVKFSAHDEGIARVVVRGSDVLEFQDPLALTPLAVELADPRPAQPHYPHAEQRLRSVFADPHRSPDLVVVHTDAHYWPERGGHLGEHGNLGLLQSRAPLLLSGAGVTQRGVLSQSVRTVDVAPTLAWLSGTDTEELDDLEGRPLTALVERGAKHVVGLLLDGANCQALLDGAMTGALPNLAGLLARGCALAGGAIAEFPSVTLVNHTSALTGVGPGRHGILNNAFYDRQLGSRILANDSSTWHNACELLRPGVRTLWEMIPAGVSACVNEPIDRGATYSTMQLIRAGGDASGAKGMGDQLPEPHPGRTAADFVADPDYNWSSRVDELGVSQMVELWSRPVVPAVSWWNLILTDAAHHVGGAHSAMAAAGLRDTDARIGAWLGQVERAGLLDETVILVTADHGMTMADPMCRGDWGEALTAAGLSFVDEAYGFLYFEI